MNSQPARVRIVAIDNGKTWDHQATRWSDFPAQNIVMRVLVIRGENKLALAEAACEAAYAAGQNAHAVLCIDNDAAIATRVEALRAECAYDHRTPGGVEAVVTVEMS
ncbi:hypothetical protein CCO03_08825 [Comamonas serinivorans]|uniref:Uncharacterized protein n=1 Tax=Comamonas serinivorans TaxID=1082851 RepID=A0A1Y0EM16_9BURK|nr:hypothetical protein [Comamonas serinivorans]ARU04693.1 hypothetical protein CCO03_08410 [Comamonas serinivorans]ARU04767.1 hypothetical protein CCO03_08825 [Comamonas serinivorans]